MKELALSESHEDYLEAILELQVLNTVARSRDIASRLNIKRGSVSGMLKKLAVLELINYEPYGFVTLTPMGEKIAKDITARHNLLKHFFFKYVELDEKIADEIACRMEHGMDHDAFEKIKIFIKSLNS